MPFLRRRNSELQTSPSQSQAVDVLQEGPRGRNAQREAEVELAEARSRIAMLEADLDRTERHAEEAESAATGRILEDLADRMSTPIAHLASQVALIHSGETVLTVADVAAAAQQVLGALAKVGITLKGKPGDVETFNSNVHLALGPEPPHQAQVVLRSPAVYAPSGRLVRKATVESA